MTKHRLYNFFAYVLIATVMSSVAWIGYEMYFRVSDPFNERWQQVRAPAQAPFPTGLGLVVHVELNVVERLGQRVQKTATLR